MLIDWFTVIAQLVNFLILMALLKVFLYDRVIAVMDERQRKIDTRLEDAEREKREAAGEKQALENSRREFEEQRRSMLEEAKQAAAGEREESLRRVRQEMEERRRQWQQELERGRENFIRNLELQIGRQLFAVGRRLFADLADEEMEAASIRRFRRTLTGLDPGELKKMAAAVEKDGNRLTVRSSFPLGGESRQALAEMLRESFDREISVDYQTDGQLIFGLEIKAGGRKLSWNAAGYLEAMEQELLSGLEQRNRKEDRDGPERG